MRDVIWRRSSPQHGWNGRNPNPFDFPLPPDGVVSVGRHQKCSGTAALLCGALPVGLAALPPFPIGPGPATGPAHRPAPVVDDFGPPRVLAKHYPSTAALEDLFAGVAPGALGLPPSGGGPPVEPFL